MVKVAHTGVLSKPPSDRVLFKIDWSDFLNLQVSRRAPVSDHIDVSEWAISSDSPTANAVIVEGGFDESGGITWVTIDGGYEGDVLHIENTIHTRGGSVNGKSTPAQRSVRQLRIRISDRGVGLVGGTLC